MKRSSLLSLLLLLGCSLDVGQGPSPDAQRGIAFAPGLPVGWSLAGNAPFMFEAGTSEGREIGRFSIAVRAGGKTQDGSSSLGFGQPVNGANYAGKRVRFSGWVRTRGVGATGARLWIRVDSPRTTAAIDVMADRPITGTTEWTRYSVVADVPADALGFLIGGLLTHSGTAWWADLTLEVVGPEVPVTAVPPNTSRFTEAEAASLATMYGRAPAEPVNLDFSLRELVTQPATVAWLKQQAVPFGDGAPGSGLADLAFLGAMVGDAPLVGLGEGTHGTSEFFRMKHRMVEYLVRERGFTAFAMEASMPEAAAIDRYVRTGEGTPEVLLSNLYFWTWNTQEVLDLIRWMRAYNASVPDDRQVRFLGFDMQFPGASIDSVEAYLQRVDPAAPQGVREAYACLDEFRNHGHLPGPRSYSSADAEFQAACRSAIAGVHAYLVANAARYVEVVPAAQHARAEQGARLVVQWEDMVRSGADPWARDRYMAENVDWLRAQLAPGAKMALWAHNQHLANAGQSMGSVLRQRHGPGYVIVGFTFGTGSFIARPQGSTGAGAPTPLSTSRVLAGSFEAYAQGTVLPRFAFDARKVGGAADAAPLAGPLPMRNVGAAFDPERPDQYFGPVRLPLYYDILIHFASSSPTTLLPFRWGASAAR